MPLQLRIASPCSETWESMTGDERVRHCAKCGLDVLNLRELSEAEVLALLKKVSGGERVCARVFRRADGTVLTRDCPTGLRLLRRRLLMGLSMAATLVVAVLGLGVTRMKRVTSPDASWFDRVVVARLIDAREVLRETRTLGPLIEELSPRPPVMLLGDIAPPTKGSP